MAWKTHPTYTNYEVESSSGKIRNKTTKRVLKPKIRWDGYKEYTLMKDGKKHLLRDIGLPQKQKLEKNYQANK